MFTFRWIPILVHVCILEISNAMVFVLNIKIIRLNVYQNLLPCFCCHFFSISLQMFILTRPMLFSLNLYMISLEKNNIFFKSCQKCLFMIRTKYIVVSSHVFIILNEIMSEAFSRLGESGHGKTSFFYKTSCFQ